MKRGITVVAAGLALAGCGSGGGSSSTATTRTTAVASTPSPVVAVSCRFVKRKWVTVDSTKRPCVPDPAFASGNVKADEKDGPIPRCVHCKMADWNRAERIAASSITTSSSTETTTVAPAPTTAPPSPRKPKHRTPSTSPASVPGWSFSAIQAATQKLAVVDSSSDQQSLAADFQRLQGKCRETPYRLAGEVFASEQDLHHNHINENAESVAAHLAVAASGLSRAATPTNCAALLAAYLVLREQR